MRSSRLPPVRRRRRELSINWQGGNPAPTVIGAGPVWDDYPRDLRGGVSNVDRVRYDEVYTGIDLEFYERGGSIEFDWLVEPRVDPSQITMVYSGMDTLSLDASGNLVFSAGGQQLTQHAPVVYQIIAGKQREVAASYRLGEEGTVRFALGEYDPSLTLVIDPVLTNSTYLGGSRNETVEDIATDALGNTYIVGTTRSADLAPGSGDDDGRRRGFVTKMDAEGHFVYTTLLGPVDSNDPYLQSDGDAVTVGPDGLPIVSFELTAYSDPVGSNEIRSITGATRHVMKLSDTGLPLFDTTVASWSLGFGSASMAVDEEGSVYLSMQGQDEVPGGTQVKALIAKVDADGTLSFAQPFFTQGAIAVDAEHNIYLATYTSFDNLPVTAGAFQPQKADTSPFIADIYIAELDSTASGLIAATYLGGSGNDFLGDLAVNPDSPGIVFLTGSTTSTNFPVAAAFQPTLNPGSRLGATGGDGFITALDLTNMELVASTFFGGSGTDALTDISLDSAGNVYVAGNTDSLDFPVAGPLIPTLDDGPAIVGLGYPRDFVVARFDSNLQAPPFSTYFGGTGDESDARLAVDSSGTLHVAGTSSGAYKHRLFGNDPPGPDPIPTADFPILHAAQPAFAGGDGNIALIGEPFLLTDAVVFSIAQRGVVTGRSIRATEGRAFSGVLADFTNSRSNASPGDFQVLIDWGDGQQSAGSVTHSDPSSTRFQVVGTHEYDDPGAYPVVVTVTDSVSGLSPATNINVSQFRDKQFEPTIAVDPTNPQHLFAAAVDQPSANSVLDGKGGLFVSTSTDGGATWAPRLIADGTDGLPKAQGDPKAVFDQFGNLFLTYLGADRNNVVVLMSTNGGKTFDVGSAVSLVAPGSAPGLGPLRVDQPSIAVGLGGAAGQGSVWVTFADLQNGNVVAAGASVTGLGAFGPFGSLSVLPGSASGGFGDLKIGASGQVLVVWEDNGQGVGGGGGRVGPFKAYTNLDPDGLGPLPFADRKLMLTLADPGQAQPIPAVPQLFIDAEVNLAWDLESGRVYAAYSELKAGSTNLSDLDIFVVTSVDNGTTWSSPIRVNNDAGTSSQFLPSIAIDSSTGNVAVGWYDTRADAGNVKAAFYVAISSDSGRTFSPNQRVALGTSNATDPRLASTPGTKGYGDYSTLVYNDGVLHPIWADNSDLIKQDNRSLLTDDTDALKFEIATAVISVIDVSVARAAIHPLPIQVTKGQAFNGLVATFQQAYSTLTPSDFQATIHWGDGAVSTGSITQPGGPDTDFLVAGSHAYAAAGAYPVLVEVRDLVNGLNSLPVSNVTALQGSQAEGTIAVDPTNPDRVFAAGVDATKHGSIVRGFPVALSDDGGVTWTSRSIADGTDGFPRACCDPRAVFDQFGNLFLTYATAGDDDQIVVLLSTDGGHIFTTLHTFSIRNIDQPSIAVGPGQGGIAGSVWLTWEQQQGIWAAGASVSGLGVVGSFSETRVTTATSPETLGNFGDIAVGPAGEVLLSYVRDPLRSFNEITVLLDPDGTGPQGFGEPVAVGQTNVPTGTTVPAQNTDRGIENKTVLAWDRSDGPHRGRVYVVYTDAAGLLDSDTNIFLRYSDNYGFNWSEPIQVNDDATTNSQFMPAVAVDQSSGNLAIGWHTGVDNNVKTRFALAMSDDGGSSFRIAYLISPGESDSTDPTVDANGQLFSYGDYTGLAFVNGVIQPIWADNSQELDSIPDPRNFDLASARISVAEVLNAPLVVQAFAVAGFEGRSLFPRLATFRDPEGSGDASGYHAKINWGDASGPSDGFVFSEEDGSFSVYGSHQYEKFGNYTISVQITGPHVRGQTTTAATIANAPLNLAIEQDLRVVRETEFTKVVATLTDRNVNSKASDFVATIDWGDGSTSVGRIQLQPGGEGTNEFLISGTHNYLSEQVFAIHVSVLESETGQAARCDRPVGHRRSAVRNSAGTFPGVRGT